MSKYKQISREIIMSNHMANMANEAPPDPIIYSNPYQSSYSNGNESFTKPDPKYSGFTPSYSAKASWGLLQRAVNTRIIAGMNNGSAKALTKAYHLEALDPKHRFADFLAVMHQEFKMQTDESTASKLSLFFIWLDEICRLSPDAVRVKLGGGPNTENFIRAGVAYLNGIQRKSYLLEVNGGRLIQNGKIFSTKTHSTAHSGSGWAIFVASPDGDFYAGSHVVSQFHHSSFLAGKPVLAAGEIIVENGYLKLITAKSGHYQPTKEQFFNGLKALERNRVHLHEAKALLFKNGKEFKIPVLTILRSLPLYQTYNVWD